jgi:hypothetical protein
MAASEYLSSRSQRFPAWQPAYEAVLTEADTYALFKLVEVAEAAVLTRRAALEGSADHHSERQAMEEALANLRVVKRDRLKFR